MWTPAASAAVTHASGRVRFPVSYPHDGAYGTGEPDEHGATEPHDNSRPNRRAIRGIDARRGLSAHDRR